MSVGKARANECELTASSRSWLQADTHRGSSFSVALFVRLGNGLSVASRSFVSHGIYQLSVYDEVDMGSSLSIRSYTRVGSSLFRVLKSLPNRATARTDKHSPTVTDAPLLMLSEILASVPEEIAEPTRSRSDIERLPISPRSMQL